MILRFADCRLYALKRLVVGLLEAMGYGETGRVEHTGKSGDGGIDGMVSQDPLGLDRVYMQAKRYARDNVIGRPAIQGFVRALHGFQADRRRSSSRRVRLARTRLGTPTL